MSRTLAPIRTLAALEERLAGGGTVLLDWQVHRVTLIDEPAETRQVVYLRAWSRFRAKHRGRISNGPFNPIMEMRFISPAQAAE